MSDILNMNPNAMTAGEVHKGIADVSGYIQQFTTELNQGKIPSAAAGGGDYGMGLAEAPVGKSSFAGGFAQQQGFPSSGYTVAPMNPTVHSARGTDGVLGQEYSNDDIKKRQKAAQSKFAFYAAKGYEQPQKKSEETFRASSHDLFERTNLATKYPTVIHYAVHMVKNEGLVVTPQMLLNLKVFPDSVKNNLDGLYVKKSNPDAQQIGQTIMKGEESGLNMFRDAPSSAKEAVAEMIGTKGKASAPKALKPPSATPPSGPSKSNGEWLN